MVSFSTLNTGFHFSHCNLDTILFQYLPVKLLSTLHIIRETNGSLTIFLKEISSTKRNTFDVVESYLFTMFSNYRITNIILFLEKGLISGLVHLKSVVIISIHRHIRNDTFCHSFVFATVRINIEKILKQYR